MSILLSNSVKPAGLLGTFLTLAMPTGVRAADVSSAPVQGQIADWALIQSKGGIELGESLQHAVHSWKFNLSCDLSGDNSGIVIQKMLLQQDGRDLFISLVIAHTAWTLTPQRSQCKPVVIDSTPGLHMVYYRDAAGKTDLIGHVEFRPDNNIMDRSSP